jgi:ElaB/YqjD/DUF883 family membrane-anchored ribosome-binding protein
MARTYDKAKIHEALELLNAAAAEEKSELQDMIGDRYDALKEFVGTLGTDVQREVSGAYRAGKAKARAAASEIDSHVHANPWAYIGGSAVLGFLVGLLVARSRK